MEIRKALPEDAAFIARNVLAAMDFESYAEPLAEDVSRMLPVLTEICRREDTLYSWRNTLVAVEDGVVAGSMTAYDGGEYIGMRELTFGLVREQIGWAPSPMDDETQAGEWYLDSLAVAPQFRRRGIARALIEQALDAGEALGFDKASLIALASDAMLVSFYESCGFAGEEHRNCFGHDYLRMVISL